MPPRRSEPDAPFHPYAGRIARKHACRQQDAKHFAPGTYVVVRHPPDQIEQLGGNRRQGVQRLKQIPGAFEVGGFPAQGGYDADHAARTQWSAHPASDGHAGHIFRNAVYEGLGQRKGKCHLGEHAIRLQEQPPSEAPAHCRLWKRRRTRRCPPPRLWRRPGPLRVRCLRRRRRPLATRPRTPSDRACL